MIVGLQSGGRAVVSQATLISGDTDKRQRGFLLHRSCDRHRLGVCATAGPPAFMTKLDDDPQPATLAPSRGLTEDPRANGGIHIAGELEGVVVRHLIGDPGRVGRVDQLVRQEDPAHAVGADDAGLVRCRHGEPPGAGYELTIPQLR